jgi:dTDP-4-amino-4,6-dideoxygalactose transaminase
VTAVPFLDLRRLHETIGDELRQALDETIETSGFIGGTSVDDFEQAFAAAHGLRGAVGCGSGTDALALALRALGVGEGAEVIVPSMTFVATAEAVVHAGATPVVVDVDATTLLLDPEAVERARTPRTRAVVPVHLYGHVAPLEQLARYREAGLLVVEDAAQAHLATDRGASVGSASDVSCFSFYPGKNLGALGDAGLIASDDDDVLAAARRLRDHGSTTKYVHEELGWCSRLDGLQARFLSVKLRHLADWTAARRAVADRYRADLADVDGVTLVPWGDGAVHHLLVVRIPDGRRDSVRATLDAAGIGTGIHYPIPLSQQPWLRDAAAPAPASEAAAGEILSLPMDPLLTTADVDLVCERLAAAVAR